MAQYWEDWRDATVGIAPTGWTERWHTDGTWTVTSGATPAVSVADRYVRLSGGTNSRNLLSWDLIDSDADRENVKVALLCRVYSLAGSNRVGGGPAAWASGTDTSETAVTGAFYRSGSSDEKIRVINYDNAVSNSVDSDSGDPDWSTNTWYWLELDLTASDPTVNLYAEDDLGGTPIHTVNLSGQSQISAADGWVGIFSFNSGNNIPIDVAAVSVATAGDALLRHNYPHLANLTIDGTTPSATHTNYPKLIRGQDLPTELWDAVAPDGGDIRLFLSDGTTEVAREVVSFAGSYLEFDGVDDEVTFSSTFGHDDAQGDRLNDNEDWEIEFIVQFSGSTSYVHGIADDTTGQSEIWIRRSDGLTTIDFQAAGGLSWGVGGGVYTDSKPHTVRIVKPAGDHNGELFVDGVSYGTATNGSVTNTVRFDKLGKAAASGRFLDGRLHYFKYTDNVTPANNITFDARDVSGTSWPDTAASLTGTIVGGATKTDANSAEIWALIPTLTAGLSGTDDTVLQIHADGVSSDYAVTDTYGRNAVWSDYEFVYHSADGVDSAGNASSTIFGTLVSTTGQIGDASTFGGSAEYFETDISPNGDTALSIQSWVKADSFGSDRYIMSACAPGSDAAFLRYDLGNNRWESVFLSNGALDWSHGNSTPALSTWTMLHSTWSLGGNTRLYVDSAASTTNDAVGTGSGITTGKTWSVGENNFNTSSRWNGELDEVRYRTSVLSADWIADEYSDQSGNASWHNIIAAQVPTHLADMTIPSSAVTATHTNFPKLIRGQDFPASLWTSLSSSGGDLRIFLSDGVTEIPREIVSFDNVGETAEIWALIPSLSSVSDTTIQLRGDGSGSNHADTNRFGRNAVWVDYGGVYHLDSVGSFVDSSGNNDMTASGSPTSVAGQLGNAADLDSGDYGQTTVAPLSSPTSITLQAWFNLNATSQAHRLVDLTDKDATSTRAFINVDSSNRPVCSIGQTGVNSGTRYGSAISGSTWYAMHGTWSSGAAHPNVYIDGALDNASTLGSAAPVSLSAVDSANIGRLGDSTPSTDMDAVIDEVRYRADVLSADWIADEYSDQTGNASWHTITEVGGSGDNLLANDVESASEVTSPALGQTHDLLANDTEAASEVSTPTVGQTHVLLANDVESTSEVSTPTLAETSGTDDLLANDVESASEVSTPTVGQTHVLLANDVESASEVSTPTLAESFGTDELLANDVESASEVSTPAVGQTHVLTATSVSSLTEVTTPTIGQTHVLLNTSVQSLSEVSTPTVVDSGALRSVVKIIGLPIA